MKKYWISYYKDFGNTYDVFWTDSDEMERSLPDNAEQITRKQAIAHCVAENDRRKYDTSFSGYATAHIYPATKCEIDWQNTSKYERKGYIYDRA